MDELPAKCCGRCRFFRDGVCLWNSDPPVPFYMRFTVNLMKWSQITPTSGTDCKAFKPRNKDSDDGQ